MKSLLIASLLLISFSSFSEEREAGEKPFEEMKKIMLEGTDLRISHLQAHKTCIQAATDRGSLKKCREEMKAKRKEVKGAMHSKKDALKSKRDAIRANKKN